MSTIDISQMEAVMGKELSVAETAKRLKVHPRTVSRWVEKGLFPGAYKKNPLLNNSPYVIPVEAIEDIENRRNMFPPRD